MHCIYTAGVGFHFGHGVRVSKLRIGDGLGRITRIFLCHWHSFGVTVGGTTTIPLGLDRSGLFGYVPGKGALYVHRMIAKGDGASSAGDRYSGTQNRLISLISTASSSLPSPPILGPVQNQRSIVPVSTRPYQTSSPRPLVASVNPLAQALIHTKRLVKRREVSASTPPRNKAATPPVPEPRARAFMFGRGSRS